MSAAIRAAARASGCTLVEIIVNLRALPPLSHLPFDRPRSARRTEPINCPRIIGPPLVYQSVKTNPYDENFIVNGWRARARTRVYTRMHRSPFRAKIAVTRWQWRNSRSSRVLIKDSELIRVWPTSRFDVDSVRFLLYTYLKLHIIPLAVIN